MHDSKENKKECTTNAMCKPKRILQAVSIVRQLNEKFYDSTEKKPLLDDVSEKPIFLQVTLKKIPSQKSQRLIKVKLPNSCVTEKTEICLITGDLDKRNKKAEIDSDVLHYKELLKKKGVTQVNEVITLRQLRTEYKPYEARRKLAGGYDVFLCDKKIAGVLPHALGKNFFKKRKFPIQINLQTSNLKVAIENALSSTVFHITCKGNSCASEVANLSMEDEDILGNISASIDVLKEQLPGKWDNILGIYVKTAKSKAIPIHMSFDNPNEVKLRTETKKQEVVAEELSTYPNAEVKVYPDGRVVCKRTKGDEDEEDEVENVPVNKPTPKRKKVKSETEVLE